MDARRKKGWKLSFSHDRKAIGVLIDIKETLVFGFLIFQCFCFVLLGLDLDRLGIDDFEVEDEVRPDFPCPYCYEDFDIVSLCSHLEDEHSCESKVTRRRRLRRVAIPNSQALSLLGRDLREAHLQVLLGVVDIATDPFLSSLILNFPASEAEEISKSVVNSAEDSSVKNVAPAHIWKSRY
ncbi:protein dehydration-induced 19 like protein 4 [Quercus suber]|uniref:Protein dehydration-induced 19 like protein 4 n=1 Tax=Quercus suber TaxID=58331 RepID=A0AAW0K421_QUESU